MKSRLLILLLAPFFNLYCQSGDTLNLRKNKVYVSVLNSICNKVNIKHIDVNVQSEVRIPNLSYGNVPSTDFTIKTKKDTLLIKFLREKFNKQQIHFFNMDSKFFLAFSDFFLMTKEDDKILKQNNEVVKINIYEPLDFWGDYYNVMRNYDFGTPFIFELIYLPVKYLYIKEVEGEVYYREVLKIYVFDINKDEPILKEIISTSSSPSHGI